MSASSHLGFYIGFDGNSYNDNAVLRQQLSNLISRGITRVSGNPPVYETENLNTPFRDKLRVICTTALGMGLRVRWGYTLNGKTVTTTTYTAFDTQIKALAVWGQSVGLSEVVVGNEEDLRIDNSTVTQTSLRTLLKQTCQDIVNAGFTGTVSTTITTNVYSAWKADVSNWQSFMKLYVNIYNTLAAFKAQIDDQAANLPTQSQVSEFNTDTTGRTGWGDDRDWLKDIYQRSVLLAQSGFDHYAFAYDTGSSQWTINDTPAMAKITRTRPMSVFI